MGKFQLPDFVINRPFNSGVGFIVGRKTRGAPTLLVRAARNCGPFFSASLSVRQSSRPDQQFSSGFEFVMQEHRPVLLEHHEDFAETYEAETRKAADARPAANA